MRVRLALSLPDPLVQRRLLQAGVAFEWLESERKGVFFGRGDLAGETANAAKQEGKGSLKLLPLQAKCNPDGAKASKNYGQIYPYSFRPTYYLDI